MLVQKQQQHMSLLCHQKHRFYKLSHFFFLSSNIVFYVEYVFKMAQVPRKSTLNPDVYFRILVFLTKYND